MTPRPPEDQAVREEIERELDTSYVIEAGAGTGKTTLIVRRILAHVKRGDPIESLVAITFTKKAALELRLRVRGALERTLADPAADPTARSRCEEALRRVDAAPIQTIHAFCDSLLRERPIEAGIDPGASTAEEGAGAQLFAAAFERHLDRIAEDPEARSRLADLLAGGLTLNDLKSICWALIEARDVAIESPAAPTRPDLNAIVETLKKHVLAAARLAESNARDFSDTLAEAAAQAATWCTRLADHEGFALARALFSAPDSIAGGRKGNKKNWRSEGARDLVRAELDAAMAGIQEFRTALRIERAARVLEIARGCVAAYELEKRAASVLDFHDQLHLTRDLLRDHHEVRRALRDRFRTIIVDEFQDTDPLQAEVAMFLAEDPGKEPARDWRDVEVGAGRLVLVGDPKQSIYGFRRADIAVYEAAKRRVLECGGKLRQIVVNFRSARSILAFVNQRFRELIRPHPGIGGVHPEYIDLVPSPSAGAAREQSLGVVVLEEPGSSEFPYRGGRPSEAEAAAVAACLRNAVCGATPSLVVDPVTGEIRNARFADCAILFRTTSRLEDYEDALKAAGVPYRIAGGRRFFSRVEIKAALALFRALDDATDEVATLALLRGPLFGISDADLARFVSSGGAFLEIETHVAVAAPALRAAIERIAALRVRRHLEGVAMFVEEALATTRAFEIFQLFPDGEQRVANLRKLVSVARRLERAGGFAFRHFVSEVQRMVRDTDREPEAEFLDDGADSISLLTIHKAKGLEWPIVVLASLGTRTKDMTRVVLERGDAPSLEFGFGREGCRLLATIGFETAKRTRAIRDIAERQRLLYVAATRARDLLVLPRYYSPSNVVPKPDAPPNAARPMAADLFDDPLYSGASTIGGERVDATTLPRPARVESPLRVDLGLDDPPLPETLQALVERAAFLEKLTQRLAVAGRGLAVTSASAEKVRREEEDDSGALGFRQAPNRQDRADRGARGSSFGTFVHRVIEHLDFSSDAPPSPALLSALAKDEGLGTDAIGEADRLISSLRSTPLAKRLAAAKRLHREVPFAFVADGRIVEGTIDLIADEGDGPLYVVDWKSDDVAGASLEARLDLYRPQGELYREAVHAATGRPCDVSFHFLRCGETRLLDPNRQT